VEVRDHRLISYIYVLGTPNLTRQNAIITIVLMGSFIDLNSANDIEIVQTTTEDLDTVFLLFKQVTRAQSKDGYKVWSSVDKETLERDVEERRQYKIVKGDDILVSSVCSQVIRLSGGAGKMEMLSIFTELLRTRISKVKNNLKKFWSGLFSMLTRMI